MVKTEIFLLAALVLASGIHAAKIISVPGLSKSQFIEFQSLAQELHQRGHEVYVVVGHCQPLPKSMHDGSSKFLTFQCPTDTFLPEDNDYMKKFVSSQMNGSPLEHYREFSSFLTYFKDFFVTMLNDTKLITEIKQLNFDLAIVSIGSPLQQPLLLPYKLGIPFMITGAQNLAFKVGGPMLPSFVPLQFLPLSDHMTFLQRVANTILYTILNADPFYVGEELFAKIIPEKPFIKTSQLISQAELLIATSTHPMLDYPIPSMPQVVHVGGLATRPAKPLPDDLEEFMKQHSKNGVIVVSFGSIFTQLPQNMIQNLVDGLSRVKYGVIMRYAKDEKLESVGSNIKLLKWIPQNDLLGHNATKLFITHCGNSGQFEALYHGVQMLGFPLLSDQHYNALRAQSKGYSITMKLTAFTPDELVANVNDMMSNTYYQDNIKNGSAMYHNYPMSSRELAAYWVEYVLKFGGKELHSHAATMPWYQYYGYDVALFLIAVLMIVFGTMLSLVNCVFRSCYKRFIRAKEKVN